MGSLVLLIFLLFISIDWTSCTFFEPKEIEILPGRQYHFSVEYCSLSVPGYIKSMNALCYCEYEPLTKESKCSIPGPTFIFYIGTKVTMTFHNKLKGDSVSNDMYFNSYKDLDITNVHVHGLHISPLEDDVFVKILPGQYHTYTYTILADHYPGTHWLHAHHHGSVSFQTNAGLASALLVKHKNKNDLMDESLIKMKENTLIFHHIYAVTTKFCDCRDKKWEKLVYDPFKCEKPVSAANGMNMGNMADMGDMHCFKVYSFCYEYCSMPSAQRQLSGFRYSIESYSKNQKEFQLFLVNGNIEPVIDDLTVNKYRRLRFLNVLSQYYMQFKFPIDNCEWNLIAIDGIFLIDNKARNLNIAPYYGEYLIPPGGRIDVVVKCTATGKYVIETSENNDIDSDLSQLLRVPAKTKLFSIKVNDIGDDIVTELPIAFPPKPDYLTDLRGIRDTKECACNTYFDDIDIYDSEHIITWNAEECGFVFTMDKHGHNINLQSFNPNSEPMSYLEYNSVYEFIMIPENHPYHQHVNPFQVQQNVGNGGFIAFDGDWYDSLGSYKGSQFTIKIRTADFTGNQVIHCHILPHEDKGMMTFVNILESNEFCDSDDGKVKSDTMSTTIIFGSGFSVLIILFLLITVSLTVYNIIQFIKYVKFKYVVINQNAKFKNDIL